MWQYNNELYHHGIKGQRWGVRRFQNEDGSLTPAGERHYQKISKYRDKKVAKAGMKIDANKKSLALARQHLNNVKKFGKDSDEYKQYINRKIDEQTERNDREFVKNLKEDETFSYNDHQASKMWAELSVRGSEWAYRDNYIKELMDEYASDIEYSKKQVARWTRNQNELMEMPIDVFTSKWSIYKKYAK